MRSTFPVLLALMVLALALANWPNSSHSVVATATAADNSDQTSLPGKKNRPTVTLNTPDERAANIEALLKNQSVNLDFTGQPLNEVLDFVNSSLPELQFQFDNAALKDAGIDPTATLVTITLKDARLKTGLDLILSQFNMDYYIHDGLMIITTKEKVDARLETRIYDCRDLLSVDSDRYRRSRNQSSTGSADAKAHSPVSDLIDVITSSTARQTWGANDGPGSICEYDGLLVINQTREVHSQIADLLEKLSAKLAAHEKK